MVLRIPTNHQQLDRPLPLEIGHGHQQPIQPLDGNDATYKQKDAPPMKVETASGFFFVDGSKQVYIHPAWDNAYFTRRGATIVDQFIPFPACTRANLLAILDQFF